MKLDQDGNKIGNPLESGNRIQKFRTMQDEDVQDDDVTMDNPEDKDDDKMIDRRNIESPRNISAGRKKLLLQNLWSQRSRSLNRNCNFYRIVDGTEC